MPHRIERVNSLLRQEISDLIHRELKDPRLGDFLSVTDVATAPDFSVARVYVSRLGGEKEKQETLAALTSAAGFLHHELIKRLDMRHVPDLQFEWDSSIERGDRLMQLLDSVSPADAGSPDKQTGGS